MLSQKLGCVHDGKVCFFFYSLDKYLGVVMLNTLLVDELQKETEFIIVSWQNFQPCRANK